MIFLDANVVLEIVLKDRPHLEAALTYLEKSSEDTAVSLLTVHLIMHFGRKQGIPDAILENIIGENELLSLTPDDYVWASLNGQGKDFEDALQVAVALRHKCTSFATLDKALARAYAQYPIDITLLS